MNLSEKASKSDVTVQGNIAYVPAAGGGLHIIDISNPKSLQIIGSSAGILNYD